MAVLLAVSKVSPFAPMHIVTDSRYVADGLTKHVSGWEDRGWIGVANAKVIKKVLGALRARSAITTFRWVKGHAGDEGNEGADRLAKEGAKMPTRLGPEDKIDTQYLKNGVALQTLTQSLAYRGICDQKRAPIRATTARNVEMVMCSLQEQGCELESVEAVWTELWKNAIRKQPRDFLWKALHGALRIGRYWAHIPGYEERGMCRRCGVAEDLEHILVSCDAAGRQCVWDLTQLLLRAKDIHIANISLGLALGAHARVLRKADGTLDSTRTRAARIVMSESAYLIWTLRCERVISWADEPGREHSVSEIRNKWQGALTRRLRMDQANARRAGPRKKKQKVASIERTWGGMIRNVADLPPDWTMCKGVLVGIPDEPG
ncbi:hypothetical protein C2E23DRAFT_732043 [Lenzites betulinus]|nr:hypothetical protein C2E23DRAFT_740133 [Lenzites betulinus]KAH9851952.1 hypothetical protein C2E23DRAFT_732043 [Lenzites betulinus]